MSFARDANTTLIQAREALRVPLESIHPNANLAGKDLSGMDLAGRDLQRVCLEGANLQGTNLTHARLDDANLSSALLQGANLVDASVSRANLQYSYLQRTVLEGACLRQCNLLGANLAGSRLQRANLDQAILTHANLHQASVGSTIFGRTNLRTVRGLSTILHNGHSIVDFSTLCNSYPLPEEFLRNVGLPPALIDYLPSLSQVPVKFQSCFISYSEADRHFTEKLCTDLESEGVPCWFAPHAMQGGKKIYEQIEHAVHLHDRLLLVLSNSSMTSEWVRAEILQARRREVREKRQILFPISLTQLEYVKVWTCFDADSGRDVAVEIREYYIPVFDLWTNETQYRHSFSKLCQALKKP